MPFTTSYLCEKGFSSMIYFKYEFRAKLIDLDANLRLKLANIIPDFKKLARSGLITSAMNECDHCGPIH